MEPPASLICIKIVMRYFFGLIFCAFFITSCASSGSVNEVEPREEQSAEDVSSTPDWYDRQVSSSLDSTSFYGFAHAAALDGDEAEMLAKETAAHNLRFEIDRFVESIRNELIESSNAQEFDSSSFILTLRNAVQQLDFTQVEFEVEEIIEENEVRQAYVEASVPRQAVIDQMTNLISNPAFSTALNEAN